MWILMCLYSETYKQTSSVLISMNTKQIKAKLTKLLEIFSNFRIEKKKIEDEIDELKVQIQNQNDAKEIEDIRKNISKF
jgi:phenylacetate-coenzyme A ligase PaaK-like adenylate-forming protein